MKYKNATEKDVKSARISCQYKIMEVKDLTPTDPENEQNNFWSIEQPYPSKAEVISLKNSYQQTLNQYIIF